MTEELKPLPCPFCGGSDLVYGRGTASFGCKSCRAWGPAEREPDSCNLWNTRSPAWRDTKEITEWKIEWETLKAENFRQHVQKVGVVQAMDDHVGMLLRILERYREAAQPAWRDIESAPKNGDDVLLAMPDGHVITAYYRTFSCYKGWVEDASVGMVEDFYRAKPTHWMPLPQPPEEGRG